MALIVKTKTKQQEKIVKSFLENMDIDFSKVEEDEVHYRTRKTKYQNKKKILNDLERSIDFVNKYKKGKAKAKSIKQLLNEL
jgi:hypothetical protein